MIFDSLLPSSIREGAIDARRRGRLIVQAIALIGAFGLVSVVMVLAYHHPVDPLRTFLTILPVLAALPVLHLTRSTFWTTHFLTAVVFLQVATDLKYANGYSVLTLLTVPILSTALAGIRSGIVWTLIIMVWGGWWARHPSIADTLFSGMAWTMTVLTGVIGCAMMILESTRKRAADEAQQAHGALLRERERLRDFVSQAFPCMVELQGTRITSGGYGCEVLLGYPAEQLVGRDLLELLHPADQRTLPVLNRPDDKSGLRREVRVRHIDGRWLWVELFLIPYTGAPDQWLVGARNIHTERQSRVREAQADRLESLGYLAAGVAHDFNNLLTVIIGFAETLPESSARKQIILAASDAAKLTRQLMTFSRHEAPSGLSEPPIIDLGSTLRQSEKLFRTMLGEGVRFHFNPPAEPLAVRLHPVALHQVILNLIANASQATGPGGTLRLQVSEIQVSGEGPGRELAPGDYATIEVIDDGCGMDAHTLAHAFDPFFTTKSSSRGTGLGLANCYGIARGAGGLLTLESAPGSGTTARLYLPKAHLDAQPLDFTIDRVPQTRAHRAETVLVVENDQQILDMMARVLEDAGYHALTATTGSEALEVVRAIEPQILVTDLLLPGMTGEQVARQIQAQFPGTAVLFISGRAQAPQQMENSGVPPHFLAKPFSSSELLRGLEEMAATSDPSADKNRSTT